MGLIDDLPAAGMRRDLPTESLEDIDHWLGVLEEQHDAVGVSNLPVGLWVHGTRRAGTTYTASVGTKMAVRNKDCSRYGIESWEYARTDKLVALIRESWEETPVKDDAAWFDALEVERTLDRLWGADLLWIDDLHLGAFSMAFVIRAIWPQVEARVKSGKATVVSTSLTDTNLGSLAHVVNDLFIKIEVHRGTR